MTLFSDVDWLIVGAVATFLLFGRENAQVLRTLGRLYGKAVRLKQELLTEFSKAADLPAPGGGAPASLRAALLGIASDGGRVSGIPVAVSVAPQPPRAPSSVPAGPWTGGSPVTSWSTTAPRPDDQWEVVG